MQHSREWLVLIAVTLVLSAALRGQDAPSAVVAGRVVDAQSGVAVPNARVTTSTSTFGIPFVLADPDGRFSLTLSAGRYAVVASKTGYVKQEMVATAATAAGAPIEIRLARSASISGRVIDDGGEPVAGLRVRVESSGAARELRSVTIDVETDDRGEYRIGGLEEGTFLVAVNGRPLDLLFFPGVANREDAEGVAVRSGDDRLGIDFVVAAVYLPPIDAAYIAGLSSAASRLRQTADQPSTTVREPLPPTALIRGRVLDGSGGPLQHAQVRLAAFGAAADHPLTNSTVWSDGDGRFEVRGLAAGPFLVAASKNGYFSNSLPAFELKDGEARVDVDVHLVERWASVEGHVLDDRGDPLQNAVVQLLQVRYEAGRRSLVSNPAMKSARTDDRGRFRLYALHPGTFIVAADTSELPAAESPGYARGYYPMTPDLALAQYVSVADGAEMSGIDIALPRVRTARITGKLLNADGEPTIGGSVVLIPRQSAGETVVGRMKSDDDFEFVNVLPGQYVLQVFLGPLNEWTEGDFGAFPVVVSEDDMPGVVVRTSAPSTIAGRATLHAVTRGKPLAQGGVGRIDISAVPVDPALGPRQIAAATVREDGTFELAGITGTRRLQAVRVPAGWTVESIRSDGVDVTDRPIDFGGSGRSIRDVEIVLTDRISTLTGLVSDDRSRPVPGAGVLVYSIESNTWYPASRFVRRTTADANGAFSVSGLPSGSYHVVAVSALPADASGPDAWQDPQYLDSLSGRASTVSITEGMSSAIQLRVISR